MEDWFEFLKIGAANALQQQAATKEIERLRTEVHTCPEDCPGRLKFYAKKGKKGRDWR